MNFKKISPERASMRNALHVIPSLDRSLGGTVECVRQISRGLSTLGYDVKILTLDDKLASRPEFAVEIVSVGARFLKYAFSIKLLSWIFKNISQYDIVIINGIWQFHGIAVFLAATINRVPFVIYPHGMLTPYCIRSGHFKMLKKLIYWCLVERWVVTGAVSVLCTSSAEMESSRGYLPGSAKLNFEVVGNGIELPQLDFNDGLSSGFLGKYNLKLGRYLIYLGRIDAIKGIDMLIRVYAREKSLSSCYQLVIAGPLDNKYAEQLRNLADQLNVSSAIQWIGAVHGEEKWRLLAYASALVLPSHHENFSLVVAEALAVATPVLTTNKVGTSDEIAAYNAGLIGDDTEDGIYAIVRGWISLHEYQKSRMRQNARLCFDENFRVEMPTKRLSTIIENNLFKNRSVCE